MRGTGNSIYIMEADRIKARPAKSLLPFLATLFTVFSLLAGISFAGVSANGTSSAATVRADGGEDELKKAGEDYGMTTGEDGLGKTMDKYHNDAKGNIDLETEKPYEFKHVIKRLFTTRYMNHTPHKHGDNGKAKKWNCNVDDPNAGTPLYHNCDVPNMMTQAIQGAMQGVSPMGFVGATVASARSDTSLGVPSHLPGGKVPATYATGGAKYTALEILGYNLHYTSYKGEWDYINATTSARLMANYGLMNVISLGVNTAISASIAGAKLGGARALDKLSQGDVIGAFGAFFMGFGEGATSEVIRSLLDSSEANVFRTNGWYRVNYGGTIYGARELTQEELSARMNLAFKMMVNGKKPESAKVPDDYASVEKGPPKPKEDISRCTGSNGKQVGKDGISKADCEKTKGAKYSADGAQKKETIKDWKANVAGPILESVKKYKLECTIASEDEKNRSKTITDFYACWGAEWPKHQADATAESQSNTNDSWQKDLMKPASLDKFLEKNPQYNINTPYVRFVCLDKDGKTMYKKDNWDYIFVYNADGSVNPECGHAIRPPIQNGFFGNGYIPGGKAIDKDDENPPNQNVLPDTRYELVSKAGALGFLMDTNTISNTIANGGLSIASMETRVANTVLDLSFAPIAQKIGLDKMVEKYIKAFRDGVYFPLLIIVLAFSAVTLLLNAARNKDYFSGLKSAFLLIFTVFISIMVLYRPDLLFKVVDSGPAQVETFVAGTIFETADISGDNKICSATNSTTSSNDLAKSFAPSDAVRTMECQIWRAFYFNPYVYGQWGTSSNNLNAAGSGEAITMKNTNGALVGDASVPMGGGQTMKNWAIYQAKVLSSGTITDEDPAGVANAGGGKSYASVSANTVPRDLYRVVDMQAGPNNGQGTDGRYFGAWAGQNPMQRIFYSFVNILIAGIGMVTVVAYAFAKIEVTIFSMLMLLFLPLVLLMGVHPTFGRVKLKQYMGTIVALLIQRIVMVALIAVMVTTVSNLAMTSTEPLSNSVITMGVCLAFLFFRKKLMSLIGVDTARAFGGSITGDKTPKEAFMQALPKSLQNSIAQRQARNQGMIRGAAGGFLANGPQGLVKGAKRAGMIAQSRETNSLRRMGQLGALTKVNEAKRAGQEYAFKSNRLKASALEKDMRGEKEPENPNAKPDTVRLSRLGKSHVIPEEERIKGGEVHSMMYSAINDRNATAKKEKMRAQGMSEDEVARVKIEPLGLDMQDNVIAENLLKAHEAVQKLHQVQRMRGGAVPGVPKKKPHPGDIEGMRKAAEAVRTHNEKMDRAEAAAKLQRKQAEDKIYYHITQEQDPSKRIYSKQYRQRELDSMRQEAQEAARILGMQGKKFETQAERTNRKLEEKYYGDTLPEDFEGGSQ